MGLSFIHLVFVAFGTKYSHRGIQKSHHISQHGDSCSEQRACVSSPYNGQIYYSLLGSSWSPNNCWYGGKIASGLPHTNTPRSTDSLTQNSGKLYYTEENVPDIMICTPGILTKSLKGSMMLDEELFKTIKHLVLDEVENKPTS